MGDTTGHLTDAQIAWAAKFAGLDLRAGADADAPGGGTAGHTPEADATDFFFDHASHDLTSSDRKWLDAYAQAYQDAHSAEKITVDAYASKEGDDGFNKKLAADRADAVADYLIRQGISADKVARQGHGKTDEFSKDDLAQNRRATLKPPPPKAPSATKPTGKDPMLMRDPNVLEGRDDAAQHVADKTPPKAPDPDPTREEVEAALKPFLHDLAKVQKHQAVTTTDKVWMAESRLREGLPGEPIVTHGEKKSYDPDELAGKIANNLPPTIPRANFDNFKKLKATDVPDEGSTTDQTRRKYEEARDKILQNLPKSTRSVAKKAMDAAVEKGAPFAAGKLLTGLGAGSDVEQEAEKVVGDYAKKVTGNTSAGGE